MQTLKVNISKTKTCDLHRFCDFITYRNLFRRIILSKFNNLNMQTSAVSYASECTRVVL